MYATRATHRPVDKDIFDAFCPIWFIVFNGYIMSNVSNFTVNFPIKPVADALNVVELASRPMFYFYSSFRAKMSQNWMGGELDLRCATDEELNEAVDVIKKGYDIFLTYKDLLNYTSRNRRYCHYYPFSDRAYNQIRQQTHSQSTSYRQ